MGRTDRLLHREDDGPSVSLRWDGDRELRARRGDSVSLALLDAGVLETTRSIKYRRPRGPYCLRGDCGTCLVRIDGRPNQRACMTPVAPGMRVLPQNRVLAGADPTALVDRLMRGGMDHHHFMVRPRIVNKVMQGVARNLAGLGTLPDRAPEAPARHQEHRPQVLIVGAGPAGRAVYRALRPTHELLWVDRLDREALEAEAGEALPSGLLDRTGVFGAYPDEGLWAATTERPGARTVLHSIVPQQVVVATGARDPTLPLPDNDRPGVVAARGLSRSLARIRARLAVPAVVIGEGPYAATLAAALAADVVAPDRVIRLEGSPVEAVRLKDGLMPARLVALAAPPAPAFELARQAGATVRWDAGGFSVAVDDQGRCVRRPWVVWATGDVTGYRGPAAAEDGRRVAQALLAAPSPPAPRGGQHAAP